MKDRSHSHKHNDSIEIQERKLNICDEVVVSYISCVNESFFFRRDERVCLFKWNRKKMNHNLCEWQPEVQSTTAKSCCREWLVNEDNLF